MHKTQGMKQSTAAALILFLALLLAPGAAYAADDNTTQSGCQICANSGDCSRAFRGGVGQFCGNWLDRSNTRQPCCCPTNAVCRVSNFACNCANTGRGPGSGYALAWLWWLLGSLMLVLCCGSFYYAMSRRRNRMESPATYTVAEPVQSMYGVSSTTPTATMYTVQPAYGAPVYGAPAYGGGNVGGGAPNAGRSGMGAGAGEPNAGRSGMSAGAGAALGGGAGLLGGLLLGRGVANARRGRNGGGGGGGGFAGDF